MKVAHWQFDNRCRVSLLLVKTAIGICDWLSRIWWPLKLLILTQQALMLFFVSILQACMKQNPILFEPVTYWVTYIISHPFRNAQNVRMIIGLPEVIEAAEPFIQLRSKFKITMFLTIQQSKALVLMESG